MRLAIVVGISGALLLLGGCSGIKTYPNTGENNVQVRTRVESAPRSSTEALLDVHSVKGPCATEFQGRLVLDQPAVAVALPVGKPSYIDIVFASKSARTATISSTSHNTVLTPKPGFRYDISVKYIRGIYSVVVTEKAGGGASGRELPRRVLSGCNGS